MQAEGSFEVTSWAEEQAGGLEEAGKVTRATFGQRFTGGIEAETVADMVMTYRDDGTAEFVGYQRVQGRLGDRVGSFVLTATGAFDGSDARTSFEVVPGSARGQLVGLKGGGAATVGHGQSAGAYSFDLEI
ncbi:MAG TPA: DUF3224 domain-containing protein [Candidatus Acidoferrales bacterium]|nr:DUF3224 domain-containing protein [Candidatus Acidoferrales bacterium]